jgi:hypothetical protein
MAVLLIYAGIDRFGGPSGRPPETPTQKLATDGVLPTGAEHGRPSEVLPAPVHSGERLVLEISDLNRKLYAVEMEKARLEASLARAERELSRQADGGMLRARHEYDLDEQDWQKLAKTGTIKYRHPCLEEKGWKPRPEELELLGLGADDAEVLRAAFRRSYDRVWKTVRPLCAKVIGDADVVDSLGPDTCIHVVVDASRRQDNAQADLAIRQVSETRAGQRALPAPGAATHPVFRLFWLLTGEMRAFEADLAESFGPEEAKRVAYAKALCHGHSTFGGAASGAPDR